MGYLFRGDTLAMVNDRSAKQNHNHLAPKNYDEPESYRIIVSEERTRNDKQNGI